MSDLFNSFKPVDAKEWKNLVQAELKGADFTETLCWDTPEGFQVKPLYTQEDVQSSSFLTEKNKWKIITSFIPSMDIPYGSTDGIFLKKKQLAEFFPTKEELLFTESRNDMPILKAHNNNTYLDFDPLGDLAQFGNWINESKEETVDTLKNLLHSDYQKPVSINISRFQNAGANHAEQLALMLLMASEYAQLIDKEILSKIWVINAVGHNFFFEIAKLRAMRILWANLCSSFNVESDLFILSESSLRNKSAMDKYNNIIRTTFESAAGIFGNSDAVMVHPYDDLFVEEKEMSLELGFKQQFILREESFLNQYIDPLKGAYFVENLTEQLAKQAWEIFQRFEANGGYIENLNNNAIQEMISASANKEQQLFNDNKLNLIGINKYPKADDNFVKYQLKETEKACGKTLFKTVMTKRLAEESEANYKPE